jgi:HPt (histidine-containing phosphotransfer) domain-containing protein
MIFKLMTIKGLDPRAASRRLGSEEIYFDLLRRFCLDLDQLLEELSGFLDASDWQNYITRIHALKGLCMGIGAAELSKQAETLEHAARRGEYQPCHVSTGDFVDKATWLRVALQKIIGHGVNSDIKRPVELPYLLKQLQTFQQACNDFDGDIIDRLAKEFRQMHFQRDIDDILSQVAELAISFDYDPAKALVDALMDKLVSDKDK